MHIYKYSLPLAQGHYLTEEWRGVELLAFQIASLRALNHDATRK